LIRSSAATRIRIPINPKIPAGIQAHRIGPIVFGRTATNKNVIPKPRKKMPPLAVVESPASIEATIAIVVMTPAGIIAHQFDLSAKYTSKKLSAMPPRIIVPTQFVSLKLGKNEFKPIVAAMARKMIPGINAHQ
jgi:hypothetical protein